jgi:holo-[acyl-carrier protein] synthase
MKSIGIDIEEIKRFKKYLNNENYLRRIFTNDEIIYSLSKKNAAEHFAARFAAKEAVLKIFKSTKKINMFSISIKNTKDGKPEVYIKNKKYKKIKISLSHNSKYAVAVAIIF